MAKANETMRTTTAAGTTCEQCGTPLPAQDPSRVVIAYSGPLDNVQAHSYHAECWRNPPAA